MVPTSGRTELHGRDIICFANDWDSDPLSKKHIMTRLAETNRILWVNSIGTRTPQLSSRDFRRAMIKLRESVAGYREVAKNITVLAPLAIPFHGSKLAGVINRRWLSWSIKLAARRLGFRNIITWTFLPSTAGIAGNLGEKLLIYHCVDEFSEFTGSDKEALLEMERRLMRRADAVIVSSTPLLEAKKIHNPKTYLVLHGVDIDHFRQACNPQTAVPRDLSTVPRPIIGFFGLVADWVDLKLIRTLAAARPSYSFVLIGKIATDTTILKDLQNVHLLGKREYSSLPAYCKAFDVGVLPFAVNALTIAANPLKLREYLAAGLPVVSTAIPEAERLSGVLRIAENADDFLKQIDKCVQREPRGPQMSISKTMDGESWDRKVDQLCEIVCKTEAARSEASGALKIPGTFAGELPTSE
jgi:glycosyltransferase involved in cell wall biosynthesis